MPRASPRRTARVPNFALYGEPGQPGADVLHLESIASRSQRHLWEIDAHVHAFASDVAVQKIRKLVGA